MAWVVPKTLSLQVHNAYNPDGHRNKAIDDWLDGVPLSLGGRVILLKIDYASTVHIHSVYSLMTIGP
jgi:hypothetical protein